MMAQMTVLKSVEEGVKKRKMSGQHVNFNRGEEVEGEEKGEYVEAVLEDGEGTSVEDKSFGSRNRSQLPARQHSSSMQQPLAKQQSSKQQSLAKQQSISKQQSPSNQNPSNQQSSSQQSVTTQQSA